MSSLPAPSPTPLLGHLWRWTRDPLRLLTEGARTGPVFRLSLWRPVVVGYRPDWNRCVLSDLDTFRSQGSLSDLTPYLAGGVVHSDVPGHDARRRELNPHFHARAIEPTAARLRDLVDRHAPVGPVEALAWSGRMVRLMLNAAFFGGQLPDRTLAQFLAPLQRANPAPLLPRPLLFRRFSAAVANELADPAPDSLATVLSTLDDGMEETRVAVAAGYDTTAHTLAWALWHLAGEPAWRRADALPMVLDEILRLYPAGWLGSRIVSHDTTIAGVALPAGQMVLYSPYLTHRDADLWPEPNTFRPDRFHDGRPAWGFIPFSAGRRTCLGTHLARLMLRVALEPFCDRPLRQLRGDPSVTAGITLRPARPLWIERSA